MQRDLRPYVCTYSDCKEADQQYDSFKQWVAHEAQAHKPVQHPPERGMHDSFQVFQDDSALQNSRQCPICLENPAVYDHIGFHLWKIAVFSLPRSTGLEDESDQGSTGSVVNGRQSQDSRLTNMNDFEPLSMEGEQEDHTAAIRDDMENHEAARLTIEALKDIPDSLQNGVTAKIGNYIFGQTTGDNEETPDFDHGSRPDSNKNSDISETDEDKIMKAQESLERHLNTLGPEHPSTLGIVATLGLLYAGQQRWAEAETMMLRALEGYEKTLPPGHLKLFKATGELGNVYVRQNKLNKAEELYQQALKCYEKTLGTEHFATLNTFKRLSSFYANQDRLEEAERMGLRALQGFEKVLGPEHGTTIKAVGDLGAIYYNQEKLIKAEEMLRRALKSSDATEDGFLDMWTTQLLGNIYHNQGELVKAEDMYKQAVKSYDALEDHNKPSWYYMRMFEVLSSLGDVYRQQGKLVEAEDMYKRAVKTYDVLKDFIKPNLHYERRFEVLNSLGDVYKQQGKSFEAMEVYEQALGNTDTVKDLQKDALITH